MQEHADLPPGIKQKITILKQKKRDFFYNKSNDYRPIDQEELAVFSAILDSEIVKRKVQIRRLIKPRPKQTTLFKAGPEQAELDFTESFKEQKEALQAEIFDLESQNAV